MLGFLPVVFACLAMIFSYFKVDFGFKIPATAGPGVTV
jgi:hypothetical protein